MFYFLLENDKYNNTYALESLDKVISLSLESAIVLIKLNRYEEAARNIFISNTDNLMFFIKCIVKKYPLVDLLELIIRKIKKGYPENINFLYSKKPKNFYEENFITESTKENDINKGEISLEYILIDLLSDIKQEYDLILVKFFIKISK